MNKPASVASKSRWHKLRPQVGFGRTLSNPTGLTLRGQDEILGQQEKAFVADIVSIGGNAIVSSQSKMA